jgi:DNA polymerase
VDPAAILKQAAKTKNPDARAKLFSLYKKQKLIRDIKTCIGCRLSHVRKNAVPWSGPAPAPIAACGEAPGMQENEKGVPFVGPAGQLLNKLLKEIGLDRDKIFVFNTVCCRPPGNRTPLPDELAACRKEIL